MAKVSKNKVSKKSLKKKKSSEQTEETEKKTHVIYDDDNDDDGDEEEGLNGANVSGEEEEEEEEDDERRRNKLLEAISSLGGQRKRPLVERSEAAVQMSEFTVSTEGGGGAGGVQLSDLIGSLDQTPSVPTKTRKQLKSLQMGKTVESPLSRQESERIQRDVAFQKASKEVTRWKSIIQQNQRAEQLVFPLQREAPGPRPVEKVASGWKARTPLEQEIFALLSANKQPIHDPLLTPAEGAAMSLEEAKIRRAELQKARALQSYYEAKARRERKIKSKKYHRVQNKAKRKEFVKRFDDMAKADPAAALEELNRMELARMQERMSLKHQNSGKWAKSKAIMAKYDEGARKAMQQQLEVNKELTQKLATTLSKEEEEEEEEAAAEVLPDFVNDAEGGPDSANPWMRGKLSEEPAEKETSDAVELTAAAVEEEEEEEEEEVVETEEEALLRGFDSRRKRRQVQEADEEEEEQVEEEEEQEEEEEESKDREEEELSEFTSLYKGIAEEAERAEATADASVRLEEGLVRIRTLEDAELLSQEEEEAAATAAADEAPTEPQQAPPPAQSPPPAAQKAGKNRKRKRGIELKEVLTKETKVVRVPLAPTVEESEEESEEELDQRGLIREAFAGDDVVSDFLKDKRQQEDAGKPKVVDLTLPGWGEWGGTGLKPSRSKRRRFRIKTAPSPPPRKDRGLPGVIISEKRNSAVSLHQVNSLPPLFQNHAQFEGSIRCPLGRTWNTERTVKKMTKPRVVTQLGAVIQPMAREELMKGQKHESDGSKSNVDWKKKR